MLLFADLLCISLTGIVSKTFTAKESDSFDNKSMLLTLYSDAKRLPLEGNGINSSISLIPFSIKSTTVDL